jgi:hypothetical protein
LRRRLPHGGRAQHEDHADEGAGGCHCRSLQSHSLVPEQGAALLRRHGRQLRCVVNGPFDIVPRGRRQGPNAAPALARPERAEAAQSMTPFTENLNAHVSLQRGAQGRSWGERKRSFRRSYKRIAEIGS